MMMMKYSAGFVCCGVLILTSVSTTYGDDPTAIIVQGTGWSSSQKESDSSYVCSSNQVMIGRRHSGDENGQTRYMCGNVLNDGYKFQVTSSTWSEWMKESDSTKVCSTNKVMTGREHKGDENGNTRYRCSLVKHNGLTISYTSHPWSDDIKESNSQFTCPSNQVMIARYHYGDENGQTAYKCATFKASYSKTSLFGTYVGESTDCVWQNEATRLCPPYVFYYDQTLRHSLRLSVKGNHIYNTAGQTFDTSNADKSHGGKVAAILTMSVFGDVYASKVHPVYLFHHSTFFAGNPVGAAGEIIASKGVTDRMTSCSGHYRPSDDIARQAIDALAKQGYSEKIPFTSCTLLQFDYMILKSGDKLPPADLRFTKLFSALIGPGKTVVCEEKKKREFCQAPISLSVPRFTSIKLCFHDNTCKSYTAGEHSLSGSVVQYAEMTISAKAKKTIDNRKQIKLFPLCSYSCTCSKYIILYV